MYAVGVCGQKNNELLLKIINGWNADIKSVVESCNQFIEDLDKQFGDSIMLLNANFTILGDNPKTFQINLNKDGVKSSKINEFIKILIEQLEDTDNILED
jgi:hypothetical protein